MDWFVLVVEKKVWFRMLFIVPIVPNLWNYINVLLCHNCRGVNNIEFINSCDCCSNVNFSSLFYLIIGYDFKISISFTSGYLLFIGILGIIAFAFGLGGGINTFKRTNILSSIFGLSLLIASGVMLSVSYIWIADLTNSLFPMSLIWIIGFVTIVLSVLGLIFIAISRKEFS